MKYKWISSGLMIGLLLTACGSVETDRTESLTENEVTITSANAPQDMDGESAERMMACGDAVSICQNPRQPNLCAYWRCLGDNGCKGGKTLAASPECYDATPKD